MKYNKQSLKFSLCSNYKGFTLIELLVAISIVAVLATIGFTLFQATQATARDGKRRADIDAISTALETHFNATTGTYTVNDDPTIADLDPDWFAGKAIPADPLNDSTSGYTYPAFASATFATYTLCAKLEKGGGNFDDPTTPHVPTGSGNYYCKLNQQQ